MCPTSPAPTISVRSTNPGRDHTVARATQRPSGTTTMAASQKAMSADTGAMAPSTRIMPTKTSQLAAVRAERPLRASSDVAPPMLRPGSR